MGGLRRGNERKEPGELRICRGNTGSATSLGCLPLSVSENGDGGPLIRGRDRCGSRRSRDSECLEVVGVLVENGSQVGTELRKRCYECLVLSDEGLLCPGNLGGDRVVCRSRACGAVAAGGEDPDAHDAGRGDEDHPTTHVLFESHRHTMAWVFQRLNAGRLIDMTAASQRPCDNRTAQANPHNRIGIGGPMAASVEIIRRALIDVLTTVGVDLEDLQITSAGRREVVRVVVDRDGGIDLDLIADISRRIAEVLDVPPLGDEFAGMYVLEVSSPGTDRPLTEEKHWRRAERRLVEATLADDSVVTGRIVRTDAGVVEIEQADGEVRAVPLSSLRRGLVQLEFSRAASDSSDEE